MSKSINEPLLCPSERRLTIKPILNPTVWEWYKKQEKKQWSAEHFTTCITHDTDDFGLLTEEEKIALKKVLAFFAASDEIVNINLQANFIDKITMKEAQYFYRLQAYMEQVHSEVYSILIETYEKDEEEKKYLLNAVETIPSVSAKAEWATKWIDSGAPLGEILAAFIAVEGIQFSGSFCFIYKIKKSYQGKFAGLIGSNDYIATDECLHRDFNIFLFVKFLQNKPTEKRVHEIFNEAVEIEIQFIKDMIPNGILGMTTDSMIQYIQFTTDSILKRMRLKTLYNVRNPYPWMEEQGLDDSANFFERIVTEYNKSGVGWTKDDYNLDDSDIFG